MIELSLHSSYFEKSMKTMQVIFTFSKPNRAYLKSIAISTRGERACFARFTAENFSNNITGCKRNSTWQLVNSIKNETDIFEPKADLAD